MGLEGREPGRVKRIVGAVEVDAEDDPKDDRTGGCVVEPGESEPTGGLCRGVIKVSKLLPLRPSSLSFASEGDFWDASFSFFASCSAR